MKQMRINKETHGRLKEFAKKNGWSLSFAIDKLLEKVNEAT